jgi:putative PEP-CTERM system TPR-repeat lipoprotein
MFLINSKYLNTLTFIICTLSISACSQSPESLISSAKDYIAQKDNKTALIQIKNALQINPKLAEGRLLLGTGLLEEGDAVGAELEFRKALDLKYSRDLVIPLLAKSLLAQGNAKKLTDEFGQTLLSDSSSKVSLLMSLTSAYAMQGDLEKSKSSHNSALMVDPTNVPARILIARNKAISGDTAVALALVDQILSDSKGSFDAWKLKGDILLSDISRAAEAQVAYKKAIELKPDLLSAHIPLIASLFQLKNYSLAESQLEILKKLFPNHPQTKLFEGQLAFHKKDLKSAREFVQQVLRVAPSNVQALQLAGVIEYQLGTYSLAESYLAQVVKVSPDLLLPRRVLIQTYLRSGNPQKALPLVQHFADKDDLDSDVLSTVGEVFLQNGDMKSAATYFEKAAVSAPNDARKKTTLALTHLMSGQVDVAIDELKLISALDSGTSADLALFSYHLNQKSFESALSVVNILDKKMPGKPLPAQLRGRVLFAKNDVSGARASFERALSIDPLYFPAISSLAELDVLGKQPALAKSRLESYLSKSPKSVQAWLALAEFEIRTGTGKDEVSTLLAKAVAANPEDVTTRLFLISYTLQVKDAKGAVMAAQNAVSVLPGSSALLDALGRTQMAAGEYNQAVISFQKLSAQEIHSHLPHMRMAEAYAAAKNKDALIKSLNQALELKPDFRPALRNLIAIDLADKNYSRALSSARLIQKQSPLDGEGYASEADIFTVQKKWAEALDVLRLGIKQVNSPVLAFRQHAVLLEAGKTADADKFSAKWQRENPGDAVFLLYLGDAALARNDLLVAEKVYLAVVNLQSKNAVANNNLAWVLDKLKKSGALAYAEKANELMPNQPAFMDTLASIYASTGNFEKAVILQTKVLTIEPNNMAYKLNLAKINILSGKKDLARKQLEELRSLGESFPAHAEVATLLNRV